MAVPNCDGNEMGGNPYGTYLASSMRPAPTSSPTVAMTPFSVTSRPLPQLPRQYHSGRRSINERVDRRYAPVSSKGLPLVYNHPSILQLSTNISTSMRDPSIPDISFLSHHNPERHVPHECMDTICARLRMLRCPSPSIPITLFTFYNDDHSVRCVLFPCPLLSYHPLPTIGDRCSCSQTKYHRRDLSSITDRAMRPPLLFIYFHLEPTACSFMACITAFDDIEIEEGGTGNS